MDSDLLYEASIQYQKTVVCIFHTSTTLDAIAKLSRLINEEYPHAYGKVIDTLTGKLIYQCQQTAIY